MEKKQSSIEWLVKQLIPNAMRMFDATTCNAIEQAKAMHKEEIIDAFGIGAHYKSTSLIGYHSMADEYYNETFGGEQ